MALSKKTKIYPSDTWPKQIGKRYHPTKKVLNYIDIIKDESAWLGGWIKPNLYLPHSLDLCLVKIQNVVKEVHAWWNGSKWAGLRVKPHHKVECWKRTLTKHGTYDNRLQKIYSQYLDPSIYKNL